ncbi:hypothetical protein [Salegentibacter flavus]|uniref:Uncharacterized protein n=1 Tax=Salegentibacter flavus TaxID=287099 RepID=A0A1I5DFB4_9FLAO|nr:hypothetical protein [Salegentibacter flavus]SFN97836.1 hypothetical protein SAMN05660413_03311 [Salegentibacter flavus]
MEIKDINKYRRTLFHETGHYIARKLNLSIYSKGAGVNEMYLKEEKYAKNGLNYSGGTTAKIPVSYVDEGFIKDVPNYIAVLIYGCIIQVLYQRNFENRNFRDCFSLDNSSQGQSDMDFFTRIGEEFTGSKRLELVEYIENEYLDLIQENYKELEKLVGKETFILKQEGLKYLLNLEQIDQLLEGFLQSHAEYYKKFIQKIIEIKNEG